MKRRNEENSQVFLHQLTCKKTSAKRHTEEDVEERVPLFADGAIILLRLLLVSLRDLGHGEL